MRFFRAGYSSLLRKDKLRMRDTGKANLGPVVGNLDWRYTRTHRQHWVDTEKTSASFRPEWRIKDCAAYGFIHKSSDGFDLFHFDEKIAHAKTVKELKIIANARPHGERVSDTVRDVVGTRKD